MNAVTDRRTDRRSNRHRLTFTAGRGATPVPGENPMTERVQTRSRNFLRVLAILMAPFGVNHARAQDQQQEAVVVTLEQSVTVEPDVLQQVSLLRPPEIVLPPAPGFELINTATESPSLVVQRNALGLGWYQLGIETEVVTGLLQLHGLAPDQRSRLLRWERNEVRAACFSRLLQIITKTNCSVEEQRVYDSMTAVVKALYVDAAQQAVNEYNWWAFAPHLFKPPAPFTYSPPPPGNYGIFHLFGGPKPPSFEEFKQYGAAIAFFGQNGNEALERITRETTRRSAILGTAVLAGGVVATGVGTLIGGALPNAITQIVVRAVIPFAARVVSQGVATAAGVIGGTVIGAVVFSVVTAVFEGIAVVEASQVPGALATALANAQNATVNLTAMARTEPQRQHRHAAWHRRFRRSDLCHGQQRQHVPLQHSGQLDGSPAGCLSSRRYSVRLAHPLQF